MITNKTFVERRRYKRFSPRINSYAVLDIPGNTIGQIIDISLSGLAFKYFSAKGKPIESPDLDILTTEQGLCLEGIPYTLVDDFAVSKKQQPFNQLEMRRHCVKFNDLTEDRITKIQSFIKKQKATRSNAV